MKKNLNKTIDKYNDEILELGNELFRHPELGYKEFTTKRILVEFFKKHGITVNREYCITGFSVKIGNGEPYIGLIAEMDAIPTLNHPCANLEDQSAAHACGHSTQCVIMAAAFVALKECLSENMGTVELFFTPAEEYTDMQYREKLISEGLIKYPGGKVNMLVEHIFDDVDVCIHLHAMSESNYQYGINSSLAGFIYKKFVFKGKASHAAVLPHLGVNALNAFSLFMSAAAMLRETFKDEDMNRFHGRLIEGGETVNSIPEKVVYESYVRSFNSETLKELSSKYTRAAMYSAMALGAECEVIDCNGYLPFKPSRSLSEVVYKNMLDYVSDAEIIHDEKSVAAGDIGDLSCFKPTIQFGYGGIGGVIHGSSMYIKDPSMVYIKTAKIVASSVYDLLNNHDKIVEIKREFTPSMTYDEYIKYLG